MDHRKHGARLLGLLAVAALGAMAFAASAQAVAPGFLIAGKLALEATASITKDAGSENTMLVPGLNFQLTCTTFTTDEARINTTTDAKVILLYSGCTTLDFTTKAEIECHVVEPIKAEALILPAETTDGKFAVLAEKVKALIRLMKNAAELGKIEPKPCVLPEDNVVTGEVCFKIKDGTNDTVEPLVETSTACKNRAALEGLNNEVTSGGVSDLVKFGGQTVTLDSKAILKLTGAHAGLTLGVSLESGPFTELCKSKTESCEAYALGTVLAASQEQESKFVFPYEGENLEPPCRVSALASKATKEGGILVGELIGELTELSFKECGGGVCTVVAQHLPYKVGWKATSEGNGTMVWSNGGSGAPAFTIKCLGVAKCVYGAVEVTLTLTGGAPAKLSNSGVALKREEGSKEACGEKGAIWEGVAAAEGKIGYKITTPSPLFVRSI